jgi:hypothetical protein
MERHRIPTARFQTFTDSSKAIEHIKRYLNLDSISVMILVYATYDNISIILCCLFVMVQETRGFLHTIPVKPIYTQHKHMFVY